MGRAGAAGKAESLWAGCGLHQVSWPVGRTPFLEPGHRGYQDDALQEVPQPSLHTERLEMMPLAAPGIRSTEWQDSADPPTPAPKPLAAGSQSHCSLGARADPVGRHMGREAWVGRCLLQTCSLKVDGDVVWHGRKSGATGTTEFPMIKGPIQSRVPCGATREQGDSGWH